MLTITDDQIHAKAVALGLIETGAPLPQRLRSRVIAALLQEGQAAAGGAEPRMAREIVIQPNGQILIDGEPFPWMVAAEPMQIHLDPGGISTVRMAVLAAAVQIIKPDPQAKED